MLRVTAKTSAVRKRGTVLVMVIGVLAMLFIIGSTLLIVSRFENQTAQKDQVATNLRYVSQAISTLMINQLREDAVGNDGVPYNRGWWPAGAGGEDSVVEDASDFAGVASGNTIRNGDLLLASPEPYKDGNDWHYFAMSWFQDAVTGGNPPGNPQDMGAGGPENDADGDGLTDSRAVVAGVAGMFGGNHRMFLRIVPHGGMVLLDRYTHPSLLAQVIHVRDVNPAASDYNGVTLAQLNGLLSSCLPALDTDEAKLRRRFLLPPVSPFDPNDSTWIEQLPELVQELPVTMGYAAPSDPGGWLSNPIEHWWIINEQLYAGDHDWWRDHLTPPAPLTSGSYSAATDEYDRRHLVTTDNNDDVLRQQRDEQQLVLSPQFQSTTGTRLCDVINPDPDVFKTGTDPLGHGHYPYGWSIDADEMAFNLPSLRTPFSLRDVLEPVGASASYRRAVQLTAYYLAMIQHTSVPADPAEQLHTAAQLAVNTIDFADGDDVPCYFRWPRASGGPPVLPIEVLGVERQPYITEAYVKVVLGAIQDPPVTGPWKWDDSDPPVDPINTYRINAVELYNPYDTPLVLDDYKIRAGGIEVVNLGTLTNSITIPAQSYIVLASKLDDPSNPLTGTGPFVPGAHVIPVAPVAPGDPPQNFFYDGLASLKILAGDAVELVRKKERVASLGGIAPLNDIVVDRLTPTDFGFPNSAWAGGPNTGTGARTPVDANDHLVRDSSLQRHKDLVAVSLGTTPPSYRYPPTNWHFTLSRQMVLPLLQQEDTNNNLMMNGPGGAAAYDTVYRPAQHNLLGTASFGCPTGIGSPAAFTNQDLVDRCFRGLGVEFVTPSPPAPTPIVTVFQPDRPAIAPFPVVTSSLALPESPHNYPDGAVSVRQWSYTLLGSAGPIDVTFSALTEVATGDSIVVNGTSFTGIQLAGATVTVPGSTVNISLITNGDVLNAWGFRVVDVVGNNGAHAPPVFPTTGSLLLVTRYAHIPGVVGVVPDLPITVAATQQIPGVDRHDPPNPDPAIEVQIERLLQMQQPDNGHLPVFDRNWNWNDPNRTVDQRCRDNAEAQGRLDVPWGQLVFEYFTALPLEELTYRRNLEALLGTGPPDFTGFFNTALIDLPTEELYETAYDFLFPAYPVVDRVADAASPIGAKVRGRINVNFAPWWVLDGLPVVQDSAALPASELASGLLDPPGFGPNPATFSQPATRIGERLMDELVDDPGQQTENNPPFNLPSVSSRLAQYMVAYRERREVEGRQPVDNDNHSPGFVTLGALCDVLRRIPVNVQYPGDNELTDTLDVLREHTYQPISGQVNSTVKPFAYLGYLQLVAPAVRLQDWATVRNHVYTVYATIRDPVDPPIWLRTQVTIDRTRCLYTSDLPTRIAETDPIGYYNAIND